MDNKVREMLGAMKGPRAVEVIEKETTDHVTSADLAEVWKCSQNSIGSRLRHLGVKAVGCRVPTPGKKGSSVLLYSAAQIKAAYEAKNLTLGGKKVPEPKKAPPKGKK